MSPLPDPSTTPADAAPTDLPPTAEPASAPTPAEPGGDDATSAEPTADSGAPESTSPPTASPAGTPAPRVPDLSPAACGELLKQHFPALFGGPPKPLKLRIQADIQQRAPGVFSKGSLGAYFRRYTGSTGYLIALGKASQRFDLDGQPAGELSEEHRALAREELARRRQLTREREQQAHAQQQAAQAELWQARQARATLLRDFERTTLTLANFCALKGLTPEALTPQLEQARREAADAPPRPEYRAPQRDERPPAPRGPRPDHHPRREGAPRGAGRGPRAAGGSRGG